MNISAFIETHGIRSSANKAEKNPFLTDDIPWDATHWLVILRCGTRSMETYYSNGGEAPKTLDVLLRLVDISTTVGISNSFESWAQALGYDDMSAIAEKRYKQYVHQLNEFRVFLGDELYEELMRNVEVAA